MGKVKIQIGIIGSAGPEEYKKGWKPPKGSYEAAKKIGKLLGRKKITLVTGGAGGIMENAAKEIARNKGIAIGLHNDFNDRVFGKTYNVCINCGMFEGGPEYLLVLSSDAIIAVGGGAGTLNELSVAYRKQVPVVLLKGSGGWVDKIIPDLYQGKYLDKRKRTVFFITETPEEAVNIAIREGSRRLNKIIKEGKEFYKNENKKMNGKSRLSKK